MTSFLYSRGIRIFDYARFAEPLRERIRQRAQEVCTAAGVEIEHVNKSHIRKEGLVARVLAARGDAPGLVHVISAMEGCPSYAPWLDKSNGHVFLRPAQGKCLHDYFYFIDEAFGLCYLRVPTWAPFGLQFYCNGHSALARSLRREGIEFLQEDNAFLRIADLQRAQALADSFNPEQLHRRLRRYAHWLCPVADVFVRLPGQEGHAHAGPGDRLALVYAHRGHRVARRAKRLVTGQTGRWARRSSQAALGRQCDLLTRWQPAARPATCVSA